MRDPKKGSSVVYMCLLMDPSVASLRDRDM
jgi:hypothetical protein